jgi:hypothetical protein
MFKELRSDDLTVAASTDWLARFHAGTALTAGLQCFCIVVADYLVGFVSRFTPLISAVAL